MFPDKDRLSVQKSSFFFFPGESLALAEDAPECAFYFFYFFEHLFCFGCFGHESSG